MQPGYATTVPNGPATESRRLRVISADSHVLEPPDLWSRGLAGTPFAARAPRVAADPATGCDAFLIDGLEPQPVSLPGAAETRLA